MTLKELQEKRKRLAEELKKADEEIKEKEKNAFVIIRNADVESFEFYPISQLHIKTRRAIKITEDSPAYKALSEVYVKASEVE